MTKETKKKLAYLIVDAEGQSTSVTKDIVARLEAVGWDVFWPDRDLDPENVDMTGSLLANDIRTTMKLADTVFVSIPSEKAIDNCLFPLGIAYAMSKPLIWINLPAPTRVASIANLLRAWGRPITLQDWGKWCVFPYERGAEIALNAQGVSATL